MPAVDIEYDGTRNQWDPENLFNIKIAGGAYKLTFDAVVEWVKTRTEQAAGAVL